MDAQKTTAFDADQRALYSAVIRLQEAWDDGATCARPGCARSPAVIRVALLCVDHDQQASVQAPAAPAVAGLAVPDDRPAAPGPGRMEVDGYNPTDDELRAIAERRTDPAASVAELARLVLREREELRASEKWRHDTALERDFEVERRKQAESQAERHRLAWLSACRDRSKIRHEMWAMQGQRDQARAAAEAFSDVVTDYMLGDVDGRAISRAQTTLHAAIAGDHPAAGYGAGMGTNAGDGPPAAAAAIPGLATGGNVGPGYATPTHLPLSEVLELAADLAQRAATPPEAAP